VTLKAVYQEEDVPEDEMRRWMDDFDPTMPPPPPPSRTVAWSAVSSAHDEDYTDSELPNGDVASFLESSWVSSSALTTRPTSKIFLLSQPETRMLNGRRRSPFLALLS
jgi:hypothetical protein